MEAVVRRLERTFTTDLLRKLREAIKGLARVWKSCVSVVLKAERWDIESISRVTRPRRTFN